MMVRQEACAERRISSRSDPVMMVRLGPKPQRSPFCHEATPFAVVGMSPSRPVLGAMTPVLCRKGVPSQTKNDSKLTEHVAIFALIGAYLAEFGWLNA